MSLLDRIDLAIAEKGCAVQLLRDSPYGAGAVVGQLRADIDLLTAVRAEILRVFEEMQDWQRMAIQGEPQFGRRLHPCGPHS